jgi:DNA helicase-2/ATP-dependent DNA helicase PcrA
MSKFEDLTEEQKKIIEHTQGPCVVLAGAGTGKTFTIIKKIKNIISKTDILPEEILCLTFSNEATNSLKNKINEEIKTLNEPEVKTFHAFCKDILEESGNLIGINNNFKLITPEESLILMYQRTNLNTHIIKRFISTIMNAKDFGISKENYIKYLNKLNIELKEKYKKNLDKELEKKYNEDLLELFSFKKEGLTKEERNRKKKIQEFIIEYENFKRYNDLINFWGEYDKFKRENNLLDFGDLNSYVLNLFETFGSEKYTEKYKYIIIDEFQDTNKIQFKLIEFLAKKHRNITIVGDPNQSIYGFRGSYKESFNHFKKTYKVKKEDVKNLSKSFRSTNHILEVAHKLIQNNYENKKDCVKTLNHMGHAGEKVKIFELINMEQEARKIFELITEKIENGRKPKEICVLYRTHNQGDYIREYLQKKGIKISSSGKDSLLEKKEVKIILSYLILLNSLFKNDKLKNFAFWNLFEYKNTIDLEDFSKISNYLSKNEIDFFKFLSKPPKDLELKKETKNILKNIFEELDEIRKEDFSNLEKTIIKIFEIIGFESLYINNNFENRLKIKNLELFLKLVIEFKEKVNKNSNKNMIDSFLKYIYSHLDLNIQIPAAIIEEEDKINLMTIHQSKGLEFETVIVTNLATNRFPITRTQNEPLIPKELLPELGFHLEKNKDKSKKEIEKLIKEIEKETLIIEERRLAYVALTRAKKNLYLTFSRNYKDKENSSKESLFLREIGYDNWSKFERKEFENIIYYNDKKIILNDEIKNSKDVEVLLKLKNKLLKKLDSKEIDEKDILIIIRDYINLKNQKNNKKNRKEFVSEKFVLSPTVLLTYLDCPKKFEFSKILNINLPQNLISENYSAYFGNLIHKTLEHGVKNNFKTVEEYKKEFLNLLNKEKEDNNLSKEKLLDFEKKGNFNLEVFWNRNRDKLNNAKKSYTEVRLNLELGGFKFIGFVDRIDELEDGRIEIIDYKTNNNTIPVEKRNFQLGFYALAAIKNLNKIPYKLTLNMLNLENDIELFLDGKEVKGSSGRIKGFNMEKLEKTFIEIANQIKKDYINNTFLETKDNNTCINCEFKLFCPKWNK